MKRAVVVTAILVAFLIVQPLSQFMLVKGNFYPFGLPQIELRSPHGAPYIYVKPSFDISFDYHVANTQVDSFLYSLDGKNNSTLAISKESYIGQNTVNYTVFKTMENLANGNHSLSVYAHLSNNTDSQILNLTITVDTKYVPPIPFIISPLNQTTYNTKQVPLIYTINSGILWSYYSLDNSNWTGFSGNITLPNLSEGQHTIKLVVTTESRLSTTYSDSAQTTIFNANPSTVNPIELEPTQIPSLTPTSSPTEKPYLPLDRNAPHLDPTIYFLAIAITVGLVVVAVVIYRRRKKIPKRLSGERLES